MAVNRMFRTCPTTGLVYHEPAEKLMQAGTRSRAWFPAASAGSSRCWSR